MKTLKLISKANGRNYFFGEINAKGQNDVAHFESAEQMQKFFSNKNNLPWITRVIKAEYSQSRTYWQRYELECIDNCTKIFNKYSK